MGPMEIYRAGLEGSDRGHQRGTQSRLASLAGQAYGAAPDQQRALVGQAIATDPSSGFALGQNLGQDRTQRVQSLSQMARMLVAYKESGNQAGVQGLYPQIAREAQAVGLGQGIPDQWDDAFLPGMQQLAQIADGAGTTPAGLREFQGMTQGLEPDDVEKARRIALGLDPRQSSAAIGYTKLTGPDGREYLVATDPRGIGATTVGGGPSFGSFAGQQGPAGGQGNPVPSGEAHVEQTLALANEMAAAGIPDDQITAFINGRLNPQGAGFAPRAGGTAPQAGMVAPQTGRLPPRLDPVNGGHVNPFASRTPDEQAALTEAAKQRAELSFLPARQAIETQGAVDRERGVGQAKVETERAAGQPKAKLSLDQATARLGRVDDLVGSIIPRVSYWTAGLGSLTSIIPGTPAADLKRDIGTLQAIAGFDELNAMRAASPTGGALGNVTERELAFLQSVVRNIETSQSPEQLRENLLAFQREVRGSWDRVRQAYEQDYGSKEAPSGGSDIDSILSKYGIR